MTKRPVLVLLAIVTLGALWWFFLIGPRNAEIDRFENERFAAENQAVGYRSQIAELEAVRERSGEFQAAIESMGTLIPDLPGLDEIIDSLHTLAQATGVELLSMAPGLPANATEDLRAIVVTTRVNGGYSQIVGFLLGLQDLPRLARVDAIAMSQATEEDGTVIYGVSLQIRFFTLADALPEFLDPAPPIDEEPLAPDDTTPDTTPDTTIDTTPDTTPDEGTDTTVDAEGS